MTTWAHATNSRKKFEEAISNSSVSAIECDVLMSSGHPSEPILAHPPSRESCLTVALMLRLMTPQKGGKGNLRKHLKLDFKEIPALKPTLDLISNLDFTNTFQNEIMLNADILPGPGFDKNDPSIVSSSIFLETCLDYIQQLKVKNPNILFSFSLGFKCNWQAKEGYYLATQVSEMTELVHHYRLASTKVGVKVILALNARLLGKSLPVFDAFMTEYPESTILAWTGSGEPSIPRLVIDEIRDYYKSKKMENRIEFDCCIDE